MILIGDAGCAFPERETVAVIDLAVCEGVPLVADVLRAVLDELVVESYILAEESLGASPGAVKKLETVLSGYRNKSQSLIRKTLPHAELKRLWLGGEQMKAFVRTGEYTPWGYIMLVAGVSF